MFVSCVITFLACLRWLHLHLLGLIFSLVIDIVIDIKCTVVDNEPWLVLVWVF